MGHVSVHWPKGKWRMNLRIELRCVLPLTEVRAQQAAVAAPRHSDPAVPCRAVPCCRPEAKVIAPAVCFHSKTLCASPASCRQPLLLISPCWVVSLFLRSLLCASCCLSAAEPNSNDCFQFRTSSPPKTKQERPLSPLQG